MNLRNKINFRSDRSRVRGKRRMALPSLEALEGRTLLASGAGFIQGFVLDNSSQPVAAATVDLWDNSGNRNPGDLLATTTTNSSGYYNFDGYSLVAGTTYQITESATGYSSSVESGDIQTTVNPATAIAGDTAIQVTVENLSTQSFTLDFTGEPYPLDTAYLELNASSDNQACPGNSILENGDTVGGLDAELTGNLGNVATFQSVCADLLHGVSVGMTYPVSPSLIPNPTYNTSLTANIGELGYLYNEYALTNQTGSPENNAAVNGAGLQLAIWALEYNQTGSLNLNDVDSSLPYAVLQGSTAQNIINAANAYLSAAAGNSEDVYFLIVNQPPGPGHGQGMLSTDLLDFTDTQQIQTQSATSINTTAGGTVVLGSGTPLTDSATLSGGSDFLAGDTLTFTLYGPSGGSVYTTTVPVSDNGTYSVDSARSTNPGGYVPSGSGTLTGTYQWVVNFSGDSNNTLASTNLGDEPESVTQAGSSVNTTIDDSGGGAVTGTLGESVYDTATVTGVSGVTPTGTVTYEFFTTANGTGTPTDETVTLNADGTVPISAATTALAAGSYSYIAIYSGDNNYMGATGVVEPLTINKGTITVTTTIYNACNNTVVTGALPLGASVYDTVSFSGAVAGFTPTVSDACYTFTSPSGAASAGSGAESTTEGPLGAGSYQFNASYAGDANYNVATASAEPLTINKGTITVTTTIYNAGNNTVVTGPLPLGASVYDTVSFSGAVAGFTPTVSDACYTFTSPSGTANAGSGAKSTTEGPLGAASYQFNASFAGDANYNVATASAEPLTVSQATPAIATTPGAAVVIANTIISGTKYLDTTGNGFSSDDTPESGVTIDLFQGSSITGTPYATTVTATNGTYRFGNLAAGTYSVAEVVPTAYIQTGGGPNGSAGDAYYTVTVTAGETYSGYNFDDFHIPTCAPTNVSYTVTNSSGKVCYSGTSLGGNTQQGDTVTATFTVTTGMSDQLTLVSYVAPISSFSDSNAYQQEIYQSDTGTFSAGTHSLKVTIPNTYYQIDFVCGQAINQLEPCQNGDAYGPDSAEHPLPRRRPLHWQRQRRHDGSLGHVIEYDDNPAGHSDIKCHADAASHRFGSALGRL